MEAQLYFLSNQYYVDFPDDKLMKNKDIIDGVRIIVRVFSLSWIQSIPKFIGLCRFPLDMRNTGRLNRQKFKNMEAAIPFGSEQCLEGTRRS